MFTARYAGHYNLRGFISTFFFKLNFSDLEAYLLDVLWVTDPDYDMYFELLFYEDYDYFDWHAALTKSRNKNFFYQPHILLR